MSWLFSQALVAEFSADTCSDGEQSAPSKSSPIPQAYCSPDRMTEFSRLSRYGITFAPLTADRGEALLTSYLAGFRARISVLPEKGPELPGNAADSGQKWQGSLARFDRVSSSWKTVQLSLLGDSEQSSVIWPRSGMTAGGQCWELPTLGRRTRGTDCGLWPTPVTAYDGRTQDAWVAAKARAKAKHSAGQYGNGTGAPGMMDLQRAVKMWPTPTSTLGTHGGMVTQAKGREGGTLIEALSARTTFPTPTASMQTIADMEQARYAGNGNRPSYSDAKAMVATPTARDWKSGKASQATMDRNSRPLSEQIGGSLNPTWVEWLMGWPLGWSDLKPLETDKFQQWLRQHGGC